MNVGREPPGPGRPERRWRERRDPRSSLRIRTVLLPLDGSARAATALPVARAIAALESATIHVLHSADRTVRPLDLLQHLGVDPSRLRGVVVEQATGDPAGAILDLLEQSPGPIVVLCTKTRDGAEPGVLGPVARKVLCATSTPVLLVPPERGHEPWAVRRILLPHDGTPATATAIGPAADLARRAGARFDVLYVAAPGARPPAEPGTVTAPRYIDQPQHEWPAWAREFLQRMRGLGHAPSAVSLHLAMARGDPGQRVVEYAREHATDLVVLAWHGCWEPDRARTLRRVLRLSSCPVLVLRVRQD